MHADLHTGSGKRLLTLAFFLSVTKLANSQTPIYKVTPLPLPTGASSAQIGSINNQGLIAAYAATPHGQEPFIASDSGSTVVPLPSGMSVESTPSVVANLVINNVGQVAGTGIISINGIAELQGFLGTAAGSSTVPILAGFFQNTISSVNDQGVVAGEDFKLNPSTDGQAFVGSSAIAPAPGVASSNANWVNNAGTVLVSGSGAGAQFVYYYSGSILKPISPPQGWQESSTGVAISNSGIAVCFGKDQNNVWHAFIFDISTGIQTIIPVPSGWNLLSPLAINNKNQVVGIINNLPNSQTSVGFVWDSTHGTRLLNDLVPAGWTISAASGINDSGQIAGVATNAATGFSGPVRLDPPSVTPPNSSFAFYYDQMGNLTSIVGGSPTSAPQLSPGGGSYVCPQTVTISDATASAVIYFTLDGSTPTTSSKIYSAPFSITATETVSAIALAPGKLVSSVASASFICGTSKPKPAPPTNLQAIPH